MPTYVSGQAGIMKSATKDLNVTHWKGTPRNGIINTTNTSTAGYETYIAGITGMDIEFDAFFDTAANSSPFATPPTLIPGSIVAFVLQIGAGPQTFTGSMIVESVAVDSEVTGAVKYTGSAKATGSFTIPT